MREKAASQRRDTEVGLTRFIAKTGVTHSLFKDDKSSFPCKYYNTFINLVDEEQDVVVEIGCIVVLIHLKM